MLPRRKTPKALATSSATGNDASRISIAKRSATELGAVVTGATAKIDIGLVRLTGPPVCGGGLYGVRGAIPMAAVLDEILAHKRDEVVHRKSATPLDTLKETNRTVRRPRHFCG